MQAGVHHLRQRHAAALPRHRPDDRADAERAARQRLRLGPGRSRRRLRQRLQHARPHLPGAPAIAMPPTAPRCRTSRRSRFAPPPARWCRWGRWPRCATVDRPADRAAVQPVLFGAGAGRGQARRLDRARRSPPWSRSPSQGAARRAMPTTGPRSPTSRRPPATRPDLRVRARHPARVPGAGGPVRKLGAADLDPDGGADRRARRALRRAAAGAGQQHPDPDRVDRADRSGRQERDPDRRVRARHRGGASTRGRSPPRSRPAACACARS